MPKRCKLVRVFTLSDGTRMAIRPILPKDDERLEAMIGRCDTDDLRMEAFDRSSGLSAAAAAQMTSIDYDCEMTLVALEVGVDGKPMAGLARVICDPDFVGAEFTVLVRTDIQRRGLGRQLMEGLLDYARQRGLSSLTGEVMAADGAMIDMARRMDATIHSDAENEAFRIRFDL